MGRPGELKGRRTRELKGGSTEDEAIISGQYRSQDAKEKLGAVMLKGVLWVLV